MNVEAELEKKLSKIISPIMQVAKEEPLARNPHLFVRAVTDVDYFRSLLPREVKKIADNPPPTISFIDGLFSDEKHLIDEMFHLEALRLWNRGSEIIRSFIYRKYAGEADLLIADYSATSPQPLIRPKNFAELSPEESARWIRWLDDPKIKRKDIIESLEYLTQLSILPTWEIIDIPEYRPLYEKMAKVPYRLARTFLPVIDIREAATLLGPLILTENVETLPDKTQSS